MNVFLLILIHFTTEGGGNTILIRRKVISSCNFSINLIKNHRILKIVEMEKPWKKFAFLISPNKKSTKPMAMYIYTKNVSLSSYLYIFI